MHVVIVGFFFTFPRTESENQIFFFFFTVDLCSAVHQKIDIVLEKLLAYITHLMQISYVLNLSCLLFLGKPEGAKRSITQTVVSTLRQEKVEMDQQSPGAAEGLRGILHLIKQKKKKIKPKC